ncbi:hypothetical protein B0A55_06991 [Friedmanniomyces simplex]|uniref:White collar 1 protein n=1 Tax=Friedmanniomyces simplex TaxID=329884 RepID=A0A4U0X8R4_9PEZI|nr:hypothetical protein B0A55_06991 [Friedmanniomyces simplex]
MPSAVDSDSVPPPSSLGAAAGITPTRGACHPEDHRTYNGPYDSIQMAPHERYGGHNTVMMMGQEGGGHDGVGPQSLDDIVNQSGNTMRRQSMPQRYGTDPRDADREMRRMSMMDYSGASSAGTMNNFGYEHNNGSMDQSGMLSGPSSAHPGQVHPRRSQSRRESNDDVDMKINYGASQQSYNAMLANTASYAAQSATQGAVDMSMNSPYLDVNMGMPMGYGVHPQHPSNNSGQDAMNMHMYSQPQFNHTTVSSPLHQVPQHGMPNVPRGAAQDQGGSNGMNTHPAQSVTPKNQAESNDQQSPPPQHHQSFPVQPHRPQSGSVEDRGMGEPIRRYDGLNGPYPVDPLNYNPNNQGFAWEPPQGGWPSTMVGKPHMSSSYKNAYSSTGFDMLGVLMRVATRPNPEINIGSVDLSCAFVVCDAEKDDIPIVYCSDNFERLTGYTKHMILGRNCRFLQSPDGNVEPGIRRKYVDDHSVLYLKNTINLRQEAQISIINYRRGGQPFMNLLTMIPITWETEQVKYFVGFQVDLVEQPNAVTNKNPNGSYQVNYQRGMIMPRYNMSAPEMNNIKPDLGQTVPRDDVSAILTTIGTGESEYAKRMWDKVLLENTDDVVHVLSLKGLFQWISPSALRVLEYEPSEIIGTALSSVCHPSDIVPVTRELKDTSSGASVNVVFRIRRKNSGYMWFEGHGSLHTEQGKGRKSIIMVGRERPVYALSKTGIVTAGGIGESELWTKMSTSGMFLFVSSNVRSLLDRQPDELVGVSIQSLMRSESKTDFGRILEHARTGKKASVKHEMIHRKGHALSAYTTLYPGDATEGQKPTFIVAQTRLIKYGSKQAHPTRPSIYSKTERNSNDSIQTTFPLRQGSVAPSMNGDETPHSVVSEPQFQTTDGSAATYGGHNGLALGHQDASPASEDNLFDELKTTKSSSWQYEIRQLEKRNRMLAEEVQALLLAKRKRRRKKMGSNPTKDCANCHTKATPEWRRGPSGMRDLCNSCGLRWAKLNGRVSPRTSRHSGGAASDIGSRASASPVHTTSAIAGGSAQLSSVVKTESPGLINTSIQQPLSNAVTSGSITERRESAEAGKLVEGHGAKMGVAARVPEKIEESIEPE